MNIAKILDTTVAENGPSQEIDSQLLRSGEPIRMHVDLASGDTVKIQGRLSAAHDWDDLHSFTDETPADVYPSRFMRAMRSVDGTVGDSTVYVQNAFTQQSFEEHS